ncbi:MAG TPA: PrsW family intramembrane metalloprotease [Anaerolineae bacterium]|nr:PrsW family intramembrane metalloprotease [Anaerolineae bacterium]
MVLVLVALLGAVIPTVFYVTFLWWLDRYEKEPVWLLGLAFAWGALPAAFLSVVAEVAFDASITLVAGESLLADLASVSVSAPLIEESAKGVALIALVLLFRREFDNVLDGIVYGAMIGFGFALTENLFAYFLPILASEGLGAGLTNIFMRTVVFGFNHAFWTATTGAAVGYARLSPLPLRRLLLPIAGWAGAVFLHGVHNAGASLVEQTLCLSLGISLGVHWGGLGLLIAVALLVSRRESQWIERGLVEEVRRGILTPHEFDVLRSATHRRAVRWQALGRGGRPAYRAVGAYFQHATELAFTRHHLRLVGDQGGDLAEIERLRGVLIESRAQALPWL